MISKIPYIILRINTNRDHLKDVDPDTKWLPFVLAAFDEDGTSSCDLSTIFFLLREHPEHVEMFLKNFRKKKNSPSADITDFIIAEHYPGG